MVKAAVQGKEGASDTAMFYVSMGMISRSEEDPDFYFSNVNVI